MNKIEEMFNYFGIKNQVFTAEMQLNLIKIAVEHFSVNIYKCKCTDNSYKLNVADAFNITAKGDTFEELLADFAMSLDYANIDIKSILKGIRNE